jgi:hypothetical protein
VEVRAKVIKLLLALRKSVEKSPLTPDLTNLKK